MKKLTKTYFYIFSINLLLFIILMITTGCQQKKEKMFTGLEDGDTSLADLTDGSYNVPYEDSTKVYGKGYYDYQDTIDTFHDGYNIPRDSIYKVYNIKEFEKLNYLIKMDSTKPGPYLDRGNHLQNIKLYREAIADYDMYIALNNTNNSAYHNRGNAHERLKEFDLALKDYDTAIMLRPLDTIAYYNKGVVYDYLQEYDSALAQYDKVIEIDPRLAKAYYNRGVTNKMLGNNEAAIKDWKTAMKLNPKYKPELVSKIERLSKL